MSQLDVAEQVAETAGQEQEPAEGGDHGPLAHREVDDPGGPDHQQVGERDQAIDAARGRRADVHRVRPALPGHRRHPGAPGLD